MFLHEISSEIADREASVMKTEGFSLRAGGLGLADEREKNKTISEKKRKGNLSFHR